MSDIILLILHGNHLLHLLSLLGLLVHLLLRHVIRNGNRSRRIIEGGITRRGGRGKGAVCFG